MRLHTYLDESRSRHFDILVGGDHPRTVDLVTVVAMAILVLGFAGALAAQLIR